MNAQIHDWTPEKYHSDPCETPSLSSSTAKTMVIQSPAHAWLEHPRLGGKSREPTKAMDAGTIVHRLVLGKGAEIAVIDADSYRTDAAKAARDAAQSAGKTPVLAAHMEALKVAADNISAAIEDHGLRLSGVSECAVTWRERVFMADTTVMCRAMLDHAVFGDGLIIDLKTTASARPEDLQRTIYNMGYDIQHAAYTSALRDLCPEMAGRERFIFLFAEIEEPYAVTPVVLSGEFREMGQRRWDRAVKLWERCMRTRRWPSYAEKMIEIEPAPWAIAKEMY